jgi:hypothetical protein
VEDLQAEIAALDARRLVVKSLLDAMKAYEKAALPVHKANAVGTQKNAKHVAAPMNETAAVAAELMEKADGPVATTQVVEEMRRRGLAVPANNTNNVISARLSNNPKFKGRRGHGYWFAHLPWPGEEAPGRADDTPAASEGEGQLGFGA